MGASFWVSLWLGLSVTQVDPDAPTPIRNLRRQQTTLQCVYHEQQHVAAELIAAGANASAMWEGEMRFYENCVQCAGVEIPYGKYSNENDEQLVVTPLSRECRREFFKAWGANKVPRPALFYRYPLI